MPFDGLTINHLVRELNNQLSGQRIEKVYQPEKDQLTLVVRQKKGSSRLIISINPRWGRMHLSQERRENPTQPTAFCMLLRKHLDGARILEFTQKDFDRIVWIKMEALNDLMEWQEKILVCEFTGKNSNVVLIDPLKNTILDGLKRYGHELSSHREVQPGIEYVAPPSQNKLNPTECDYETFCRVLWSENHTSTVSASLFRTMNGFSPVTCREICNLTGTPPDLPVGECGDYEMSRLYNTISQLVAEMTPTMAIGVKGPEEYFTFTPAYQDEKEYFACDSINMAMDRFYTFKMAQARLESLRTNIGRNVKTLLDKAYKKLFFQEGDLEQAQKSDSLRLYGELLTTYGYQIAKGQTRAVLPNFDGQGETEIELLPYLTPQQNAQRYFKQYAKAKKAINRLEEFIRHNRQEIEYLESVQVSLEKAPTIEDIEEIIYELEEQGLAKSNSRTKSRRPAAAASPRHFMSTDGLSIRVGKNNRQNDTLTLKTSRKTDLWLHAQGYAGAHVILELPSTINSIDDVPISSLEEAAILAGYYSRGKDAEKVAVDYTFRSRVKKPRNARPGMVIYDNYWTIYVNPSDKRLSSILKSSVD